MMRAALLWMSRSKPFERWVKRRGFARRAVHRFMPGEELDAALGAAKEMQQRGMGAVVTELGENVTTPAEAVAVADDYMEALDRIREMDLDVDLSVKPTHLGLDLGMDVARDNLHRLVAKGAERGDMIWVDMEDSSYVDRTLEMVHHVRETSPLVGVCLQAYLHRTPDDLAALMDNGRPTRVRLVKGAYREPREQAIPKKKDVDDRYRELAVRMLSDDDYVNSSAPVFGTHDAAMINEIRGAARERDVDPALYEFHMLYGIQRELQERLNAEGAGVRVLVSYGEHWYPWYLRRLAERPANLWFVAKQMVPT